MSCVLKQFTRLGVYPLSYVLLYAQILAPAGKAGTVDETIRDTTRRAAETVSREGSGPAWEEEFRALPDPARLRQYMKQLSARPHHVGSPYDKENAEWILARFKEWGFDASIESFDVLFPTPTARVVELVEPVKYVASLKEPVVPEDPTSALQDEQLVTYNAFSPDGDVAAPLVYVNYGVPADYEQLERMGISVRGAIVIARYGSSWRGIKPKLAAEHGAVGCLMYSDPEGDGYYQGDVFPRGAWRPPDGVQRGSVVDMPLYPGDPLTPGVGATANARRLPLSAVTNFPAIPVLPLSYSDAQPLLAVLGGPVAPDKWRGALPLTYHVGPGPAKVHLKIRSSFDIKRIYNVIGTIRGATYPDEWVIRGNHHDAWVFGAEDPVSALVAMLEEARAFGTLLNHGWKPKRTIMYCAWDGEEVGLLGSTEWVEAHAGELRQHAALYINTDANGRGFLFAAGSHILEKFINSVARVIEDPETHLSVWKRAQLLRIANAPSADERQEIRQRADLRIDALGSGSDYTAFLDHIGVPSLSLGFGSEDGGGIYHSIYDSFYWYTHFSDTTFSYGCALAQTAGTAMLRFADAELLPYEYVGCAETFRRYVEDLQKLVKTMRDEIAERNTQIEEGLFAATSDPKERFVPPKAEDVPPFLNFAPLENALTVLMTSAARYQKAAAKFSEAEAPSIRSVNARLLLSERALTSNEGLPSRSWYKHQIYAPGLYTGYGVKTIPAVREAIEQKKWKDAEAQIERVATVLEREAAVVESAATELERVVRYEK
jgi:N-acetylated-alpha-linked acidic dipeptidase